MKTIKTTWLWWFAAFILLLPFMAVCYFVFPSADDYAYAHVAQNFNYWYLQLYDYYNWNGRYFSNLLVYLNPIQFNTFSLYHAVPAVLIILLLIGSYYVRAKINFYFAEFNISKITPIFAVALILIILPGINESLYWYTGAVTYFVPLVLLMFLSGNFLATIFATHSLSIIHKFLTACLIVLMAGCNEIATVVTVIISFLFSWMAFKTNKSVFKIFLFYFLLAVCCFCLVLLSPGNKIRASHFTESFDFIKSLWIAAVALLKLIVALLQHPVLWLIGFVGFGFVFNIKRQLFLHNVHPFYISIFALIVMYLLYFAAVLGMGMYPPMRVHFFLGFIFLLLVFVNVIFWADYLKTKIEYTYFNHFSKWKNVFLTCALVLLFIDFIKVPGGEWHFKNNLGKVYYDLFSGSAAQFRKDNLTRKQLLEHNINKQNSCIPAFTKVPQSIFFIDINTDSNSWLNRAVAQFYNYQNVTICK